MGLLDVVLGRSEGEEEKGRKSFLSDDLKDLFEDPDKERLREEAEKNAIFTDKVTRMYR